METQDNGGYKFKGKLIQPQGFPRQEYAINLLSAK